MDIIHVGAEQLRRQLADILTRVHEGGDHVIVKRYGTPQAVLIPYTLYEQLADLIDQRLPPQITEEEFEHLLIEKGVIRPRDTTAANAQPDRWKPVPTTGKPLSEVIIEERR